MNLGVASEVVVLISPQGTIKGMLYADFEAILDGMVGVPEFAGQEIKGAYCWINDKTQVLAMVLFTIDFSANGIACSNWNLPLHHLATHAKPGPNMGAGPIRLACSSQCPVAWHQEQLWEPVVDEGSNDFLLIQQALNERSARFGLYLSYEDSEVPKATDTQELSEVIERERRRAAGTIKDLRLKMQEQQKTFDEAYSSLRLVAQQKEEILNAQLKKLLLRLEALEGQHHALQEQNAALEEQVQLLGDSLDEQAALSQSKSTEIETLAEQYRQRMAYRLEQERAKFTELLHQKEIENLKLEEQIEALQVELKEQRSVQFAAGADELLQRLQAAGLNFVANHAGAGHVHIAAEDVFEYMENPVRFAAAKCQVSESHYRAWLKHYQNPCCQVLDEKGETCGKRVLRVDVPAQFQPGVSDRNTNQCRRCLSDVAIENVLQFR